MTKNGATQATFAYDGDGNRRSKTGGGQATTYVNDARGLAQVLQATTGATTTTYVAGIAQYDPSQAGEAERWGYPLADAQNARLLLDGSGVVARRWEWEPFGTARAEGGTTPARFGYGGEERDDETGLVNLRARYYDPALGRFLSRDTLPGAPTNAQGWNRYAYVENDPINHLDPSGHRKIKYENGQDPDDDDRARKRAQSCRNPGRYTGSCPGGPPDPAYAAEGEAGDAAKRAGRAASAGNLAAAAAWAQSASHFASIAGTAAAQTAAIQAWASVWAAVQAMQASRPVDQRSSTLNTSSASGGLLFRCGLSKACDEAGPSGGEGNLLPFPENFELVDDYENDCLTKYGESGYLMNAFCSDYGVVSEQSVNMYIPQASASLPSFLIGGVRVSADSSSSPGGSGGGGGSSDEILEGGTYVLRDASGSVRYVGRTNNIHRRRLEHARDIEKGGLSFSVDRYTNDYAQQRGREHIIYEMYGRPDLNRIRPVSLKRKAVLDYYIQRALELK